MMQQSTSMTSTRTRCARACDACKRRKEKCNGVLPCNLCFRRGKGAECQFSPITTIPTKKQISSEDTAAVDEVCTIQSPTKRRRIGLQPARRERAVEVPAISAILATDQGSRVLVGDSSTLGLLRFVYQIQSIAVDGQLHCNPLNVDLMLETEPTKITSDQQHSLVTSISSQGIESLVQHYVEFTNGIFDLFSEAELFTSVRRWHSFNKPDLPSSVCLLALAIGAQERQHTGDSDLGEALFLTAYQETIGNSLRPPSIGTVQCLLLITLYLLIVCRRNAAFTHLGSAVRAAQTIGISASANTRLLSDFDPETGTRAWKCLRILELSTCASLGRPLATTETRGEELWKVLDDDDLSAQRMVSAKEVDSAGLKLCHIAEKILKIVYEEKELSIEFAHSMSQYLKDWAKSLPDILVDGDEYLDDDFSDQLPRQLCRNHMTAAYYWTIILLTRPFLMNDVLEKVQLGVLPGSDKVSESLDSDPSFVTFIDACINSAFRCLEATIPLLQHPRLGRKLFLVVNTTLVSSLVLGLAVFGDYDKTFPLERGLDNAESFLLHMAAHDPQAAQYLSYVQWIRASTKEYVSRRDAAELDRRSVHVYEVFGTVQSRRKAATDRAAHGKSHRNGSRHSFHGANADLNDPDSLENELSPKLLSLVTEGVSFSDLDFLSAPEDFLLPSRMSASYDNPFWATEVTVDSQNSVP